MVLFTFFLLWVSDADRKTAISFIPAFSAASSPCRLGTSAEYTIPGLRLMRDATSTASASCGIHLGFTKLVISMAGRPVSDRASISATLSVMGIRRASFWRPSLGLTSYSVTSGGSCSSTTRGSYTITNAGPSEGLDDAPPYSPSLDVPIFCAMRLSVAVVSPPGYPHSAAFAEVAETIRHGLTTLGHDALVSRDLAAADRRHIVLGAHLAPGAGIQLPPGSIIYNLEQVDDQSRWMTGALLDLYRRHPLWDYSATNIERLVALGVPRPTHVPIGYVPSLTRIAPAEPDIDVLFYGSLNERRKRVIDRLRAAGVRVEAVFGVYGGERDALIARAKLVLNVHYYEAKVFEVVRVSYLLANGRAVVSERGSDPAEEAGFASAVAFADHDQLVDTCLALLQQPAERQRLGEAGLGLMRARPRTSSWPPPCAPWARPTTAACAATPLAPPSSPPVRPPPRRPTRG